MAYDFEVDGRRVLGFDTGFDSRAFAQAKMAQLITEPGMIVHGDRVELWKASGVREVTGANSAAGAATMVVWGPLFEGTRFDLLFQENSLTAITAWIQAILTLGKNSSELTVPLWPCAAIINESSVFFMAPSLARRWIMAAAEPALFLNNEQYVHPDLCGMDAAAFTAAAMLYRVFTGTAPFSAGNESLLHQDIREGNYVPIRLAVPGLDARFAALIQTALDPADNQVERIDGTALLSEILEILKDGDSTVSADSLIYPLSEADLLLLEKEKAKFLKIKTVSVNTRRFVMRNTALLIGCLAALVIAIFVAHTFIQSHAEKPTTAGMGPTQVIESYYNAIGEMDHQMMEACVIRGAGKNDISMVINYYVLSRVKQSYEFGSTPLVVSANAWQRGEVELLDAQVLGATDLQVKWLAGDENDGEIHYQISYILWIPTPASDEAILDGGIIENRSSRQYPRSDLITLVHKKGKWRISDIKREYN